MRPAWVLAGIVAMAVIGALASAYLWIRYGDGDPDPGEDDDASGDGAR
jgi:hypothetical protein